MEKKQAIVWLVVIAVACGLFAFFTTRDYQPSTQPIDIVTEGETFTSYPDWTLEIPSIDFNQQMVQVTKRGTQIPVPDGQPGYYLPNAHHIFIVGHNQSVFNRLSEIPDEIKIWKNGEAQTYNLVNLELAKTEDISMEDLFKFNGVAIMTCAGEKVGDSYDHRLILYYQ